jgi:hypothetical protein
MRGPVSFQQREPARPSLEPAQSVLTNAITQLGNSLFKVLSMRSREKPAGRKNLWNLHRELLRLQALVEEIGTLSPGSAAALWSEAGSLTPNPIPSAETVVQQRTLAMSQQLHQGSPERGDDQRARISLVTRYIGVVGKVIAALRSTVLETLPVSDPDIAELLTRLFQSKVSVYRVIKKRARNNRFQSGNIR